MSFMLGYTRCILILIRMAIITVYTLEGIVSSGSHFGLPLAAFFGTYTLINLLMVCKAIMETFNWKRLLCLGGCTSMLSSCCNKKRRVASEVSALLADEYEEETEGEIL